MVTFYDFFCVMTVHYLRSNLSNNGPLFAPQIPDNPTQWIWTMQEIKLSDIICFPARPFCMQLKLKGLELFVSSSLPLPHVYLCPPLLFTTAQQLSSWPTTKIMLSNSVTFEALLLAMVHAFIFIVSFLHCIVPVKFIIIFSADSTLEAPWEDTSL